MQGDYYVSRVHKIHRHCQFARHLPSGNSARRTALLFFATTRTLASGVKPADLKDACLSISGERRFWRSRMTNHIDWKLNVSRSQRENTTDGCFRSRAGCFGQSGAFARNARYDTACRTSKCCDFRCRPECGDPGIRRHARYESARRRETCKTLRHDPTMQHLFRWELETDWQRPAQRGKDRALASSGMVRVIFKQGVAPPQLARCRRPPRAPGPKMSACCLGLSMPSKFLHRTLGAVMQGLRQYCGRTGIPGSNAVGAGDGPLVRRVTWFCSTPVPARCGCCARRSTCWASSRS